MTTAEKPVETMAVAVQKESAVGMLPPEIRAALAFRKQQNVVAAELAKLSWGAKLEQATRLNVVEWCKQFDVDPLTELEVLGNKLYRNAAWHLRKLGEMVEAGLVEYAVADHVGLDPRLAELAAKGGEDVQPLALKEMNRRAFARIQYGIPDEAEAAVLFRIKLRSMEQEIVGVAWAGGGTKSKVLSGGEVKQSDAFDPIGTAEPVKTAETRAARRAVRMIAGKSKGAEAILMAGELEAGVIETRIQQDHKTLAEQRPAHVQTPIPSREDPFEEQGDAAEDDAA